MVGVGTQDAPADAAGLAAGQTRHDGVHLAGDKVQRPVVRLGGTVQAVGLVGFHNGDDGPVGAVQGTEEPGDGPGHAAHARLQEDVGGFLGQLLVGLVAHGAVALHDPGGDVLVAFPGGILYHDPALFLSLAVGQPHRVVVVQVGDGGVRALGPDVGQTLGSGTLGHVHHRVLPQLVGGPGHAAAVVAVGGGDKGDLAQLGAHLFRNHLVVGQFADIHTQPPGQVTADGKAAAQHLESIQAEPVAFILYIRSAQTQGLGRLGQVSQGGGLVNRETGVEPLHLGGLLLGKKAQVGGAALPAAEGDHLELLAHLLHTSFLSVGSASDRRPLADK